MFPKVLGRAATEMNSGSATQRPRSQCRMKALLRAHLPRGKGAPIEVGGRLGERLGRLVGRSEVAAQKRDARGSGTGLRPPRQGRRKDVRQVKAEIGLYG